MFGKLIKYEWRAMGHMLLPMYLVMLLVAAGNGLLSNMRRIGMSELLVQITNTGFAEILQMIISALYFGLMVALFVLTFVVVVQRFYKGVVGDEGYLVLTAPVKSWQIPAAKCIMALVFSFCSGVVAIAAIILLAGPLDFIRGMFSVHWGRVLGELTRQQPLWGVYGLEVLLLVLACGAAEIYHIYFSIMLGQLSNAHKAAFSFLWYVVTNVVISVITWVGLLFISNVSDALFTGGVGSAALGIQIMMLSILGISLLQLGVFAFGTQYLMRRKLNV